MYATFFVNKKKHFIKSVALLIIICSAPVVGGWERGMEGGRGRKKGGRGGGGRREGEREGGRKGKEGRREGGRVCVSLVSWFPSEV